MFGPDARQNRTVDGEDVINLEGFFTVVRRSARELILLVTYDQ